MDVLLTRNQVQARVNLSRTAIYRMMRKGQFPLPLKLGTKAVRWPESELNEWLRTRPRAVGDKGVQSASS